MSEVSIGFMGGGQLGRMLGEAGKKIDVQCMGIGASDSSASSSCKMFSSDDIDAFFDSIDVFTFESEHEGLELASQVNARSIPIRPSAEFVKIAGDRFLEKSSLQSLSIPTAPFVLLDPAMNEQDLSTKLKELFENKSLSKHGIVIKTRHGGYDGKGQWVITDSNVKSFDEVASEVLPAIANPGCIVEGLVDFSIECSILASRSTSGEMAYWPLTHNIHEDSILQFSFAPITEVDDLDNLENQAKQIANTICESNDYIGTIAVECFVTENGLVVNEIAPRVHNSGHWTIEGCETSQFEQHLRAISGMELGDTSLRGFSAMINIVGRDINIETISALEDTYVHWYDKEVRPKRKVGHITVVGKDAKDRDERVAQVLALL